MSGYGGGVFGANEPVTRQQMAAILYRYLTGVNGNASTPDGSTGGPVV